MSINIIKKKKGKMYACFAFFPNGEVKRWKYVTDLSSFSLFLNKSHASWKYFNVYDKGTKAYLKRFYPGSAVPKTLSLLLLLLGGLLTQKFTFSKTFTIAASARANHPMKNTFNKTTLSETTLTYGIYYCATIPNALSVKKEVVCS